MGKEELQKCRKKLNCTQTENARLKHKINTMKQQLDELQNIRLLSESAAQNILVQFKA